MKATVLICAGGLAMSTPSPDVITKFEEFKAKLGRTYVGTEYDRRLQYFERTLQSIKELEKLETGTASYTYLHPFADLSEDEYSQMTGHIPLPVGAVEEVGIGSLPNVTLPSSLDWVAKGAVNPIQNQGQCGDCWAFSTVATLEGAGFVNCGKLVKLSEQEVVDCIRSKYCNGCHGGNFYVAMDQISRTSGIGSEADYPYRYPQESKCHTVAPLVVDTGAKVISSSASGEDQIAQALVMYGPLSIAVDARDGGPFQNYRGGVLHNPSCSKTKTDHAINVVGYGVDKVNYWKLRNSWGTRVWGEHGYGRLFRGDCSCGVCTWVVTATGVSVKNSRCSTPTPPPPTCQDERSFCPKKGNWECQYFAKECKKSCGCCDTNPPAYCKGSGENVVV